MHEMTAWVFALMATVAPPPAAPSSDVADVIARVVWDDAEAPLFDGPDGRARTAALLTVWTWHESRWRNDRRGDGGASYCLGQVRLGPYRTREGWTGPDLEADASRCLRVTLRLARASFRACARLPEASRMAVYASGRPSPRGAAVSRRRVAAADRALKIIGPPRSAAP